MSIDAVALLRIKDLPAPRTTFGTEHLVDHRGDASLLHTFIKFQGMAADERALALRQLLGHALDSHDDPRGILFFPDVCEPAGTSYEAIVREVSAGEWAPKVDANHIPARIANAPANTHEAMVARMTQIMDRDAAMQLDMMAQVNLMVIASTGGRADAVGEYQAALNRLTVAMGAEFANEYDTSVRNKVEHERARHAAHVERGQKLYARAQAGEPLVSPAEVSSFFKGDGANAVFNALKPSLRDALEKPLGPIDVDKLPDDDLANQLSGVLRRSKKDP